MLCANAILAEVLCQNAPSSNFSGVDVLTFSWSSNIQEDTCQWTTTAINQRSSFKGSSSSRTIKTIEHLEFIQGILGSSCANDVFHSGYSVYISFNCVSHYNDGQPVYIMASNPIQQCYQGEWNTNLPFVTLFSVLYGILLPTVVAVIFSLNRKKLDDHKFVVGYGSLVLLYRKFFFFWELVSMLKRAAFVIMTQFLTARKDQYSTKFAASISTIGFFSGLEILFTPFATRNLNMLNST
jgi:hypothetical protein